MFRARDFAAERRQMVEKQLRRRGIICPRTLAAMEKVPREEFVPLDKKADAYLDCPLDIGNGQTISQPYMVALMTQCLQLKGTEKVLEIGTGSGYQTAILAELADEVYTIERVPSLAKRAQETLLHLGYENIFFHIGDGTLGWPEPAYFEGIIVTAGAPDIPETLIQQLATGGRIVIPVGNHFSQRLVVGEKHKEGLKTEEKGGCVFVPLKGIYGWKEE